MAEEILVAYKADVSQLTGQLKTVQTEMKTTETVAINSATKTTEAFDKTTKSFACYCLTDNKEVLTQTHLSIK